MTDKTHIRDNGDGWHIFLRSAGYTVAAVLLIALGFFGAMAVSGMFA